MSYDLHSKLGENVQFNKNSIQKLAWLKGQRSSTTSCKGPCFVSVISANILFYFVKFLAFYSALFKSQI